MEKKKLPQGMTLRDNGTIMYRFSVEGKRYTVYGKTKTECRQKEQKKRREIEEGLHKAGKFLTVSEYCEQWLKNKAGTVKETTLRTDGILLNRICKTSIDKAGTTFGSLKLTEVEAQNVKDLQRGLLEKLTVKDKGKTKELPPMKTRSANDSIYLLRSVYKTAVDERLTSWNPVTVKPLKRTEALARDTIHRALTQEETAAFMEVAAESWYYNLYVLLLNTGLRMGEAGALCPSDISKESVRVCRTITRNEVGGYEIGEDTKTAAGKRTIPLNAAASDAIRNQKEVNMMLFNGRVIGMKEPVFRSPQGSLLKSANVNYDIQRCCQAAGIERFSVHAFRDTFATRCVESGMEVKALQEIMGHTDVTMTLGLYSHAMEKRKVEQLKAVNFM